MISIDLAPLIDKLDPPTKNALEGAAGLCLSRTHFTIELEHWLLKILESPGETLAQLLQVNDFPLDSSIDELNSALSRFRTGNSRPPVLSPNLQDLVQNAWLLASVETGHQQINGMHLLCAMLLEPPHRRQILESCTSLHQISPENLRQAILSFSTHSAEPDQVASQHNGGALDRFTVNLTERARQGEIDPVIGRDTEIRQCIDIFSRRRQNNPILVGDAGVGKTAVVEGLALRIASGDVPPALRDVQLLSIDLSLIQAGASIKGEFEKRLRDIISEIKAAPYPILTFIDEAHTLIGAGGAEGQGDAANLLKPALARGELRTIGATTWSEYRKYFERDPALTRRFQVIQVNEPEHQKAIAMMRGIAPALEQHHRVRILDEAIEASVSLSARYIPGRQLPDKCVSLLDTACARVSLSQTAKPAPIEDLEWSLDETRRSISALKRECLAGIDCSADLEALEAERQQLETAHEELSARWQEELHLVQQINSLRQQLEQSLEHTEDLIQPSPQQPDDTSCRQQLEDVKNRLAALQQDKGLVYPDVNAQVVAEIVSGWTGIPTGKMVGNDLDTLFQLEQVLEQRVVAQPHAMKVLGEAIRSAKAGLSPDNRPMGVFMMTGPSGVGKTETALALADILFGGEQNLTLINMSEFKEEHKVSMLLGAPPGYVGFGEGGVLTEAARRKPYSVILLDEMEKAHPGVQDIFYNLFDKGSIKDGEGRDIDFRNTLIIMTANVGEEMIRSLCGAAGEKPGPDQLLQHIRPELLRYFKSAFLGRTTIVPYYPLDDDGLKRISEISLDKLARRIRERYNAATTIAPEVVELLLERCSQTDTGARHIDAILNQHLLPRLATACLNRIRDGLEIKEVQIDISEDRQFKLNVS